MLDLPKEHGFWVMMPAALLSGLIDASFSMQALALSGVCATLVTLTGGLLHKKIRKSEWAQLAASTGLALLVVPAGLVSNQSLVSIFSDVAAWASVFVGCGLAVRASFARASKRRRFAPQLQIASFATPCTVALALAAFSSHHEATAVALVGAAGTIGIAIWRPTPKRLKAIGISMAFIVTVALLIRLFI